MGLETVTYVPELNQSNPIGASDPKSEGDDHLRNIKKALLNTFGAFVGTAAAPKSITLTEDQLNDAAQKAVAQTIAGLWTHTGRLVTDDSIAGRAGFNIPDGVAPTSPVQGDIWATATDILVRNNGANKSLVTSAGVTVLRAVKTADESIVNNTIQDDDHLFVTVVNGKYYQFKLTLHYSVNGSVVPDFKYTFSVPAASTGKFMSSKAENNQAGVQTQCKTVITGTGVHTTLVASQDMVCVINGILKAGANGTFQFRWAQNTTDAGNATIVKEGSSMTVTEVG